MLVPGDVEGDVVELGNDDGLVVLDGLVAGSAELLGTDVLGTVFEGWVVVPGTVEGVVVVRGTLPDGCVVLPGDVVDGIDVLSGTVPGGTVGCVTLEGTVLELLLAGCVVPDGCTVPVDCEVDPGCVAPGNVDGWTELPGTVLGCVEELEGDVLLGDVLLGDELEGVVCANAAVEAIMASAMTFNLIAFMTIYFGDYSVTTITFSTQCVEKSVPK